MKIIHDDVSLFTMALIIDWGLPKTCMVEGCKNPSATIIVFDETETPGGMTCTICEQHHQESTASGKFHYTIVRA